MAILSPCTSITPKFDRLRTCPRPGPIPDQQLCGTARRRACLFCCDAILRELCAGPHRPTLKSKGGSMAAIRHPKDFWSGVIFVAIGLFAIVYGSKYTLGSAA